jgi:hypothetical protein
MRSVAAAKRLIGSVVFLSALGWASQAHAQLGVGTWVRTDAAGKGITMTVAPCCNGGFRLTYQIPIAPGQPAMLMVVDSPMDGTEVPALVGGKPSGETMAIKRVDDHHYRGVLKMNGQPIGTSTGTLSADAKTLTVETVSQTGPGAPAEKIIETWIKK